MTKDDQTQTKRLWLRMLEWGGRWSAAEIAKLIGVPAENADKLLRSLVDRGYLKTYPRSDRKNGVAFGIDASCKIPRGLTVRDVLKVMA